MVNSQAPSSTRLDPKIRYYIHRTNEKTIVPLIPADQLPFHLKDFPPNLNHRQLAEGGWKFLDDTSEVPFPLPLLNASVQPSTALKPNKASGKTRNLILGASRNDGTVTKGSNKEELSSKTFSTNELVPASTQVEDVNVLRKAAKATIKSRPTYVRVHSLTDSMAAIYTQDAHKFGYKKLSPKKRETESQEEREYCRRWIRTGGCIHETKGCWYRHEMPLLEELRKIGIMKLPQWYRESRKDMLKLSLLELSPKADHSSTLGPHAVKTEKEQVPEKENDHITLSSHGTHNTSTANDLILMDMEESDPKSQASPIAVVMSKSSDKLHDLNADSRAVKMPDSVSHSPSDSIIRSQQPASTSTQNDVEAPLRDSIDPHANALPKPVIRREQCKTSLINRSTNSFNGATTISSIVSAPETISKPTKTCNDISRRISQAATKKNRRTCTPLTDSHKLTILGPSKGKQGVIEKCDIALGDSALRIAEDTIVKLAKISNKRKVLPRKICKVKTQQDLESEKVSSSSEKKGMDVLYATVDEAD